MDKISIRKTDNEDLIYRLHTRIFPDDDFYYHNNNYYWLVNKGDKVVGFCIATIWTANRYIFLSRAGVIVSERGRNLQRRMIRVREQFARRNNINLLLTYVKKDNIPSFVNLIKTGYIVYNPQYPYAESDCFYLKKRLDC